MQDIPREVLAWDAGYLAGYDDRERSRPNLLVGVHDDRAVGGAIVVDLRKWRIKHGRCDCANDAMRDELN